MEYDSDIYRLSKKFIQDYPISEFPETMYKLARPYTCLLIDTHDDFLICVPFRSDIHHNNAYLFTSTERSRRSRSGLDYSKIIIIQDPAYIDSSTPAVVDHDEYTEMIRNLPKIIQEVNNYVDTYINHINGSAPIHLKQFERKYRFSTLPYFHAIMGI